MVTTDPRGWEPWQLEYVHGAFYLFPPRDAAEAIDDLRRRYDPVSAEICGAHISLSEPLSAPVSAEQVDEIRRALGLLEPFDLEYGPLTQLDGHRGVVCVVTPAEPFFELRRALHATSAFHGVSLRRAQRVPHITVAEFITAKESSELLEEVGEGPTGAFRCSEVVLAAPDTAFRFRPLRSFPLGGPTPGRPSK